MNTAILFSTLIFSASSSICDVPGLCNGEFVGKVNALDSFDCWKKCISTDECNYASFMPCYVSNYQLPISKKIFTFQNATFFFYILQQQTDNCFLFNDCPTLETNCHACQDFSCRTSSKDCPQCDFSGLCSVSKTLS